MAGEQEQSGRQGRLPPYVSFATFKTLIADLQAHGVPARIDRSVLTRFSGQVGSQLLSALRFLHLTNDDGVPDNRLPTLVAAYGTDQWSPTLAGILKYAYAPVFEIDLATATPSLFSETFARAFPGADTVVRKCVAFFLPAAKDAGMAISPRIMAGKKPRAVAAGRRPRVARQAGTSNDKPPADPRTEKRSETPSQVVFDVFDPTNMPQEVQQATLALLTYLKSKGL